MFPYVNVSIPRRLLKSRKRQTRGQINWNLLQLNHTINTFHVCFSVFNHPTSHPRPPSCQNSVCMCDFSLFQHLKSIIFPLPFLFTYLTFTNRKTFCIWVGAIISRKCFPNYEAIYDRPIKMKFIASRVARGNIFLCRQNIIRNGDLSYIRLLVPAYSCP